MKLSQQKAGLGPPGKANARVGFSRGRSDVAQPTSTQIDDCWARILNVAYVMHVGLIEDILLEFQYTVMSF